MRALLVLTLTALTACGGGSADDGARPRAEAASSADPGAETPAPPAADGFVLAVDAPRNAAAGKPVIARVVIEPRSPWHMNLDFPARLSMAAPMGIDLDAPQLNKNDAERLDDDALVFPVVFTPKHGTRGKTTLTGEVHFAVCGNDECAPMKAPVEFSLEIT